MQLNHTNEVKFDNAEVERLLTILKLLEGAEQGEDAIWFDESDREEIREIRKHIETATGRED